MERTRLQAPAVWQQMGEVLGNNQYVAQLIQQETGGDLFRIETVQEYPGTMMLFWNLRTMRGQRTPDPSFPHRLKIPTVTM